MTRRNKRDFQRSKVYAWENAQSWSDKPGSIKRRLKKDGKWGIELTDPSPNTLSKIEILFIVEKLNKVFDLDIKVQCKPKSSHKAYYRDHGKLICIPMTWANNWSVLFTSFPRRWKSWLFTCSRVWILGRFYTSSLGDWKLNQKKRKE